MAPLFRDMQFFRNEFPLKTSLKAWITRYVLLHTVASPMERFCMTNSLNKCKFHYTINREKIGLNPMKCCILTALKAAKKAKFERSTLLNKQNNRWKHCVRSAVLFTAENTLTMRKMLNGSEIPLYCIVLSLYVLLAEVHLSWSPGRYMPWPCVSLCLWHCVCLSVSVTSRCSTKMAKHSNTQTTPQDSPGTDAKIFLKFE